MHLLERNKKVLWFANRTGETYETDTNGLKTGEKTQTYGEPQKIRVAMSISSGANNIGSQGLADLNLRGIVTGYTHNAITEDMNCPMDEEAIVWYGIEPTHIEQTTAVVNGETVTQNVIVKNPYNYRVVRKAISMTNIVYYLKEVDVS